MSLSSPGSHGLSHLPFPPITDRPLRLAVMLSGSGTTLLNLVEQIREERLSAVIPIVIASQKNCRGVERAVSAGLECQVIRPKDHASVQEFSHMVFDLMRTHRIDLVALAGFLSLLTIPPDFAWRVINIHPSLIPAFCGHGFFGHHVHEAAIARGVKISGCTVHFADNHYDHGPIILQRTVCVPDAADAEQLASLVFEQEKIAYPEAIRLLATGRVSISGSRTLLTREANAQPSD